MTNLYVYEIDDKDNLILIRNIKDLKEGKIYKVRANIKEIGVTLNSKYKLNSFVIDAGMSCDGYSELMQFKTASKIEESSKIRNIQFIGKLHIKEIDTLDNKMTLYTFISNDESTIYHLNNIDDKCLRETLI